jgi:Alpha-glutamyl/putrescinyl thymine pyrophosphorylase clade 3
LRPKDQETGARLREALTVFDRTVQPLPGVQEAAYLQALTEQLVESIRRIRYVDAIKGRAISATCADPQKVSFDPIKAALFHRRNGDPEEAFWLVFLFIHFGKHARGGWRYIREIYGRFGEGGLWDWATTRADVAGFREWLHEHRDVLINKEEPGGFGNHRKYESLDAHSENGTGAVIESYVKWVKPPRTHEALVDAVLVEAANDPGKAFALLYESMDALKRFGRTARFDYLTMLGKLGLADIAPNSPYLIGATGPLKGARLLFGIAGPPSRLDALTTKLGNHLGVGMQVMEDSLCNWQKSPANFKPYRG